MRRLFALIPAILLVLTLAPAARAATGTMMTSTCNSTHDPSTTGAILTLRWTDSGMLSENNRPIKLLTGITVANTCQITWARFRLDNWWVPFPAPVLEVNVAPLATRSLGRRALEHLGLWEMQFTNSYIRVTGLAKDPCLRTTTWFYSDPDLWVLQDGRVTSTRPPC